MGSHDGSSATHWWTSVDGGVEAGDDRCDRSALAGAAGMQHADHVQAGRDHRGVGEVQVVGIRRAAVALDPTGQRFLRRATDSDDQLQVVAQHDVVEQLLAVLGDRRRGVLGDDRQQPVVLPEDRVHEGVEEEVRAIDPEWVSRCCMRPPVPPVNERWLNDSSWAPSWPTMSTLTCWSPRRPR